jgi:hypothetical protein
MSNELLTFRVSALVSFCNDGAHSSARDTGQLDRVNLRRRTFTESIIVYGLTICLNMLKTRYYGPPSSKLGIS